MKPSQLQSLLAAAIPAHLSVLITGKPGIAKTSIAKQAAEAAGYDLIISHPAVSDPTDFKGLPWPGKSGQTASFIPIGDVARVLASTKPTVWMFDDLGQAPSAVQAACMPWLLERACNGHQLPDHVTVLAATNRRTDRAGVTGILEPVKSRFATIVELEPDVDEWATWALAQPFMPPELVAYIRFQPDALCQFEPTADLVNCPLPRTWEHAGRVLACNLPKDVEAAALAGAVGEGQATQFRAFREMYQQLPSIESILADPTKALIPEALGALYATVTGLASKTTLANFPKMAKYAERLVAGARGDFAMLLLRDAGRREPKVQPTTEFVRLMTGELGQLVASTTGRR